MPLPRGAATLTLLLLLSIAASAGAQIAPDRDWRTLETPHFRVTFPAGMEEMAGRTASRAEWAHDLLAREFISPPSGRIDIVLTDDVDLANGSATPLPTNRIVLHAYPPTDVPELAFTTDWLELLVLHEMVHIFHLDYAGGVWGVLRSIFGRNAGLFPGAFAPSWLVEGLATHFESVYTDGGRVHGTVFPMMLRAAALSGDLFTIDRASGEPRSWPGGTTRYLYGAFLLDYLAEAGDRGWEGDFVERYARQTVPYRLDAAARAALGAGFTAGWSEWTASLTRSARQLADSMASEWLTEPEILSEAGRSAHHPRFSPDGRTIAYSASTGRAQPGVRLLDPEGGERLLAPTAQLGPLSWTPDGRGVLFGDLQFRGPHRIHTDLWLADDSGVRRVTHGERLSEPDVHPDGRQIVALRQTPGSNEIVVGALGAGEFTALVAGGPDLHWGQPRWSPDGRQIAAVRWERGGLVDVVVLDRQGSVVREVTRDRALDGSPAWSPDGRFLLFWSDRTGIPAIHAFRMDDARLFQVTSVLTGAFDPAVSPDGGSIAFSYYQADGYHIARIPFDTAAWRPAAPPPPELTGPAGRTHEPWPGDAGRYSAWPSVAPAAWTLLATAGTDLGAGLGAAASGEDLIGRHSWSADLLVHFGESRTEAGAVYRYDGFGTPAVEIAARQGWDVACAAGQTSCGGVEEYESALLRRRRAAQLSATWTDRRVRSTAWVRPALLLEKRDLEWRSDAGNENVVLVEAPADAGVRLEVGRSSARGFPLSAGPQTGFSASAVLEGRRYLRAFEGEEAAAGYRRVVGRSRAYRTLGGDGSLVVLALRADAGAEFGSRSPGLDVGGASGGGVAGPPGFGVPGVNVAFPVRGYGEGAQFGDRAVTLSAEVRAPLVRVERGVGLLPVHLERLSGHIFADAGGAWCSSGCPRHLSTAATSPHLLPSLGAELVAETRFGFRSALPLRLGAALPLREDRRPVVYLRIGRAF